MRKIQLKIYEFDELSEESKEKAIDNILNSYYSYNNFAEWAIDDCELLEPPKDDLVRLFGDDYKFPLIENNRKIYFSTGWRKYIDVSKGMIINNESQFLIWLGIPKYLVKEVYFNIGKDTINFEENNPEYEFTVEEIEILDSATEKFEEHCQNILNNIERDIDYRYSDEAIIEDSVNFSFFENGNIY